MVAFNCRECGKEFRSERALNFHTESHKEEAELSAWSARRERSRSRARDLSGDRASKEAEMEFSSRGARRGRGETSARAAISMMNSSEEKRLCCKEPNCTRSFQTKVMLDFHMEREHKKKQEGALEITRDGLSQRYDRLNRDKNDNEEKPVERLTTRRSLREESKPAPIIDDDPKKHSCPECGMKFVSERAQSIHLATMHEKTEKEHKCVVCGKEYTSKQAMETHMKVFHGDYDPGKGLLKKVKMDDDDDDFKCDICGKSYSSQRSLNAHRVGHGVGQEELETKTPWRSMQAKDPYEQEDRSYRVKLPDALENRFNRGKDTKEEKKEEKLEDYDTFMKRINARRESTAVKIEKESISDIKNIFCKYCNDAFYTQRAVDVHIMTMHAEEGERETKRSRRRKEMGMDDSDEKPVAKCTHPFECDECGRGFGNFQGMKVHLKSSHQYRETDFNLWCEQCGRKFSTMRSKQAHVENAHYHHCEQCGEKFSEIYQLEAHIRRRHKTQIKCKTCGQQFRSEAALAIHMESHRTPDHQCDRCTQSFLTENELNLHKLDHEERDKREQMAKEMEQRENAHECKLCKRKFRTEKSYLLHMQEHKDEADQRKECPKCFKLFMTERSLEAHFTQAHPELDLNQIKLDAVKAEQKGLAPTNKFEDERFYKKDGWRCKKCNKTFDSKDVYEYHMKKHEDAHRCRICKEEFRTKIALDVHMKQHEDEKLAAEKEEFECEKCNRTFESQVQLKFHMTSAHDQDVTGYECKQCGKMLSSESSLALHMECHEFLEELEIKCKICKKTFTTEKALALHEETAHIEEVIMKCTLCDRQFDSERTLKIHMKNSHPVEYKYYLKNASDPVNVAPEKSKKRYQCQECDASFMSENTFKLHMRNAHVLEDIETFNNRVNMSMKYRMEETLEDIDDLDIPKLKTENPIEETRSSKDTMKDKFSEYNSRYGKELDEKPKSKPMELDDDEPYKSKIFKCDECPKEFRSAATLRIHKEGHEEDRREEEEDRKRAEADRERKKKREEFNRQLEEESKTTKFEYKKPALTQDDSDDDDYKPNESFKCEACGKSFMTEMMLKYHECTAKKQDEDEFKCSECGKQYWSQRMLDIHKKTHIKFDDEEDELTRDILNMKIELPVKRTVIDDTGDDDLMICEFCDQEFTSAVLFRIHKRAHENEHNYNITSADLLAEEKAKNLENEENDTSVKNLL